MKFLKFISSCSQHYMHCKTWQYQYDIKNKPSINTTALKIALLLLLALTFFSALFTGIFVATCVLTKYLQKEELNSADYISMVFGRWLGYFLYIELASQPNKNLDKSPSLENSVQNFNKKSIALTST